ncbi:MAG: acylphosphatase [Chloroflexota bacterium]
MADLAFLQAIVTGRVQGVYFRAFTSRQAIKLGLTGYVRNLPGGESVEVLAEGERTKLEELVQHLKIGPSGARIEDIEANWSEFTGTYSGFTIKY